MRKQEFLTALQTRLSGLPQEDVEERVSFYGEMIDDRVEEGLSEEDAVTAIGPIDAIAEQTLSEIPLTKLVREKVRPRRQARAWEIVLIVLGFPVWFPLLAAALVLLFAVYLVIWAVIVCLWAAEAAVAVSALAGVFAGVWQICRGELSQGLLLIAAGFVLIGLSVFLFLADKAATKGAAVLSKKLVLGIKSLFVRKENAI
ncbi:MAG: DUF1700 domain-containing protein [Clostridia bacterium]|nr:DUF1700 domain-containing protein [Clostridia bacterium]